MLLLVGRGFIKRGQMAAHRLLVMIAALLFIDHLSGVLLAISLACRLGAFFRDEGWSRPVYFSILISHTILAAAIVPMIIITLSRALRERLRPPPRHRALDLSFIVRMYVSVTGVIVYFMLYHLFAA